MHEAVESSAKRIIVALDCPADEAIVFAEKLAGFAYWVKIGMTLFYAVGPGIVARMHKFGFKVFVDLKLYDIPYQVRGAACSLAQCGVDLFTVSASGGKDMMQAAVDGAQMGCDNHPPAVCAITVLTSMDADVLKSVGVDQDMASQVSCLARLARDSGLDGVVCSPKEATIMRELLGEDAYIITPGVRPKGAALGDQSRVATPKDAFEAGASHLVIGRPITRAPDPVAAFNEIVSSIEEDERGA